MADNWIPYPARITSQVATGSESQFFLDGFFPAWGDLRRFTYLDLGGQYGSDATWFAGLGLGGREIFYNRIVGAYIFADRDNTEGFGKNNLWWVINPGLEMIMAVWDARINFYVPLGSRQQYAGDTLVATPLGLDIDAGFNLDRFYHSRFHAGAYFYQFTQRGFRSITGGETGIAIPFKYLSLQGDVSYDNVNGTGTIISLRFDFGGAKPITVYDPLVMRLTDLVRRHLGTLYTSGGIPVERH